MLPDIYADSEIYLSARKEGKEHRAREHDAMKGIVNTKREKVRDEIQRVREETKT